MSLTHNLLRLFLLTDKFSFELSDLKKRKEGEVSVCLRTGEDTATIVDPACILGLHTSSGRASGQAVVAYQAASYLATASCQVAASCRVTASCQAVAFGDSLATASCQVVATASCLAITAASCRAVGTFTTIRLLPFAIKRPSATAKPSIATRPTTGPPVLTSEPTTVAFGPITAKLA